MQRQPASEAARGSPAPSAWPVSVEAAIE